MYTKIWFIYRHHFHIHSFCFLPLYPHWKLMSIFLTHLVHLVACVYMIVGLSTRIEYRMHTSSIKNDSLSSGNYLLIITPHHVSEFWLVDVFLVLSKSSQIVTIMSWPEHSISQHFTTFFLILWFLYSFSSPIP